MCHQITVFGKSIGYGTQLRSKVGYGTQLNCHTILTWLRVNHRLGRKYRKRLPISSGQSFSRIRLPLASPPKAVEGNRAPRRWRVDRCVRCARSVMECASPLALCVYQMHSSFFHFSFRIGTCRPGGAPLAIVVSSGITSNREFQKTRLDKPKPSF